MTFRKAISTDPAGAELWRALREPVVALLLMPFLLYALMGPGTMAARAPDGALRVVLCMPEGPLTVDPGQGDKQPGPCAWSLVVGQPALAAPPMVVPLRLATETRARHGFDLAQHQHRLAVLTPSARGPPRAV